MSAPSTPLIRLERLRRSARLAIFALVVFFVRVGIVTACAPSDLAETLAHQAESGWVATDTAHDGSDQAPKHSTGHCLHCSCHHAVALPSKLVAPMAASVGFVRVPFVVLAESAQPDLSLRPPIL